MEASFARSILVDAPMAVVAIDGSGAIRSSNATADAFFARDGAAGGDLTIGTLLPELDVPELTGPEGVERFNARRREGGGTRRLRVASLSRPDAFVDVQAARFSVGGEPFVTLFIQDATAVVAAEAALQDLRMQITYNWRLNSLGEMASMVAHELNQPLSAILNFLDAATTLLEGDNQDRAQIVGYVGSAAAQAERASDVIRRLRLLMSRDTGLHASAHVAEVVNEIMPILQLNARDRDAEIVVRVPAGETTRCDRVQVQQLIINLVRNALDAPPSSERRRILITGEAVPGGYKLSVEDNGPGVPESVAERLFDPMISTKPGGMGLGLSICRTIVEAHNGSIAHARGPCGGAAFTFTLRDEPVDA